MNEQELRRQTDEFFLKHPAGMELLNRWQKRMHNMKTQLIHEKDVDIIRTLQGGIQMYETVVLPEVTTAPPTGAFSAVRPAGSFLTKLRRILSRDGTS